MNITLDLKPSLDLTDGQFTEICRRNRDLRLERTATGELVIMPPTGGETGARNSSLTGQLWFWNRQTQLGRTFDSSTGFRLPDGAIRSPDAAWVTQQRWQDLAPVDRQGFVPLCPDFAVELKSATDDWRELQVKLQSYITNGLRLGWLIDPQARLVLIYQPEQPVLTVNAPTQLTGDPVLPGFVLDLTELFTA
ncbi:MAG: Uma2 family endonuclease [Leptolyngbya sp. RL_3_1]|nr:Uma2 family endonuclease [Leptolyngbya sp. RL_3_1]